MHEQPTRPYVIDTFDDGFAHQRQFGPFPNHHEAEAWATQHGATFAHAIVRPFVPIDIGQSHDPSTIDHAKTAVIPPVALALAHVPTSPHPRTGGRTMKTHEENVREHPHLVRDNLAAAQADLAHYEAKLKRARSPHNQAMWRGRAGWARKMIARYEDDLRIIATTLALALVLLATPASANVPTREQPVTLPANCPIVATYPDDGTRIAACGGLTYIYDPDGNRWVNAAGNPLRAPGQWYVTEEGR